ncbi:MAG: hypothetical protein SFV15_10120 [Polyangiaceae bacterium]|nr:hypothetical protein [Polyangiaceae bacterium]
MIKHPLLKTTMSVFGAVALASCSANSPQAPAAAAPTPQDYPGVDIAEAAATLLHSGACTGGSADGSTSITIALNNGETAYLTLRPSDNMVLVNGIATENCQLALAPTTAFPGQFPTGKTISIVANGMVMANDSRSVILDFVNGVFGEQTTGTAGAITINLGNGTNVSNTLKVRGSNAADAFYLGKGTGAITGATLGPFLFNMNGGTTAPLDSVPDVILTNVHNVIVSSGPGADKIVADGTFGTAAAYPFAIRMFGGPGSDVLTGGAGNDFVSGDLGGDTMSGGAGANTYVMGNVAQGATGSGNFDTISVYSLAGVYANDTVDFSQRTGDVSVTLATTATTANGESGEGMVIPDTVSTVIGGYGDDTISAAGSLLKHTLKGGPGDDILTGSTSTGVDTLIGGTGSDSTGDGNDTFTGAKATVDYSARTTALTVKIDSSGSTAGSGDQAGTSVTYQGPTALSSGDLGVPASGLSTVTGLAGMTTDAVGRYLTIAGATASGHNGTYKITSRVSATSVVIDVSANTGYVGETSSPATFTEIAHVRTIQPTTASTGVLTLAGTGGDASTVTGLANMSTTHSAGLYLVISGTAGGTDDSGPKGYKIVSCSSATACVVDASPNTSFATDSAGFSWSLQANYDESDTVKAANVLGSAGANTVTVVDTGAHRIIGGAAADTITGGAGADYISGMGAADTIYGGEGDDTLIGGDGTDAITGGDGNDVLEGDQLADTFNCDGNNTASALGTAPGNSDLTVDFTSGTDLPTTKPANCEF